MARQMMNKKASHLAENALEMDSSEEIEPFLKASNPLGYRNLSTPWSKGRGLSEVYVGRSLVRRIGSDRC
jgi:hypothetical protein